MGMCCKASRAFRSLPGMGDAAVDIDTADKWGDTPEASAQKKGHTAIVSLLQEYRAP